MHFEMKTDIELLFRYFRRETSPEEEASVSRWLAEDTDGSRAAEYRRARILFENMVVNSEVLDRPDTIGKVRRPAGFRRAILYAASAAAILLVVAGTNLWTRFSTMKSVTARTENIYVPAGKSMVLTLEDGTRLWLNGNSEIEYPNVFGDRSREIRVINGEVLLDVAKDEDRPFIVETFASEISVLGTKFNVQVDEKRNFFSAALLRGEIHVSNSLVPGEEYLMKPNQVVSVRDSHLVLDTVEDPYSVECWVDGIIDVTQVPFDELMRKFEAAYDVTITIDRDELPDLRYSRGKIRVSEGIVHAMNMLSFASDFTYDYDPDSNTIVIR